MKKKYFYTLVLLLIATIFILPTACTDDSEESAESLAKKFCDCNKIEEADKRERCIDNINFQLQFHRDDFEFMTTYNRAANACYN